MRNPALRLKSKIPVVESRHSPLLISVLLIQLAVAERNRKGAMTRLVELPGGTSDNTRRTIDATHLLTQDWKVPV